MLQNKLHVFVARFFKHIVRVFIENDSWYLEFECDWLLNKIYLARDRAAVVTDRAAFVSGTYRNMKLLQSTHCQTLAIMTLLTDSGIM